MSRNAGVPKGGGSREVKGFVAPPPGSKSSPSHLDTATTTGWSIHVAPALLRSSLIALKAVTWWPV